MKPYYYVYRVGNKAPTIRHYSLLVATKEAERLSNQHPGETFEILQCLGITRTAKASTFWMDGVAPPTDEDTPDDGWIEHDPTGPVPKVCSMVRFKDGDEVCDSACKWPINHWDHTTAFNACHITHYKP